MRQDQTDRAFELAENWINGNRSDVIQALEDQSDPIVAIAIAFQISACLHNSPLGDNDQSAFENRIDRLADDRESGAHESGIELRAYQGNETIEYMSRALSSPSEAKIFFDMLADSMSSIVSDSEGSDPDRAGRS